VEFSSKVDLRPLIQWAPSLSHFHRIKSATPLQNLNIIPSRFDGSRNKPKRNGKFRRATEIFKKTRGCRFCTPPRSVRGLGATQSGPRIAILFADGSEDALEPPRLTKLMAIEMAVSQFTVDWCRPTAGSTFKIWFRQGLYHVRFSWWIFISGTW